MTIDLKDKVSIGDRLAALEAVNAETSMRVSQLETEMEYARRGHVYALKTVALLTIRVNQLEAGICPEPMEETHDSK